MKKLIILSVLLLLAFSYISLSQEGNLPYVNPDMIQISYDGVAFSDASTLVSNIQVVVGQVTAIHVTHARRGDVITCEGQLGSPDAEYKATWKIDTGLIPATVNKFYFRFKFGCSMGDSPFSDPSDMVKLIGKPAKPINTGVQ